MSKEKLKNDFLNNPSHYTQGKYECKDVVNDLLNHKSLNGGCSWFLGNAIKYLWRVGDKKGDYGKTDNQKAIEDIDKAIFYLNELKKELNENDTK